MVTVGFQQVCIVPNRDPVYFSLLFIICS